MWRNGVNSSRDAAEISSAHNRSAGSRDEFTPFAALYKATYIGANRINLLYSAVINAAAATMSGRGKGGKVKGKTKEPVPSRAGLQFPRRAHPTRLLRKGNSLNVFSAGAPASRSCNVLSGSRGAPFELTERLCRSRQQEDEDHPAPSAAGDPQRAES